MEWLGMFALGSFIGFIITYGVTKIDDWKNPGNVISSVLYPAVAGAVFTFIQYLGGASLGSAIFGYPIGLGFGCICQNLRWVVADGQNATTYARWHVLAFVAVCAALLALALSPSLRSLLPSQSG